MIVTLPREGALVSALAFALTTLAPAPAYACRAAEFAKPYLWPFLPAAQQDAIIAEVEILSSTGSASDIAFEARIISMPQGDYAGSRLIIKPTVVTSCDGFPSVGAKGIIAGRVLSVSIDALTVDPIRAPSQHEMENLPIVPELPKIDLPL